VRGKVHFSQNALKWESLAVCLTVFQAECNAEREKLPRGKLNDV